MLRPTFLLSYLRAGGGVVVPPQPPSYSYDDEALARRLQEQWLSEDSSAGQGEGVGFGGSTEVKA